MSHEALRRALDAWHEADRAACETEGRLREAAQLRDVNGSAIPEALLREVLRRRAEANARLREAVALSRFGSEGP